jgi:hypothetical protein
MKEARIALNAEHLPLWFGGQEMKIVTCSPGYRNKFQDFYYSFDKKFINGFIRLGHSVIPFSDRDYGSRLGIRALGTLLANRKLLAICESYRPDLLIFFHADRISTISAIKKMCPACRVVNIDCDPIINEEKRRRLLRYLPVADATLITSAGEWLMWLRKSGLRGGFVPNPTDPSIENVDSSSVTEKTWDLIFLAGATSASDRWNLIRTVAANAPTLKVGTFGAGKRKILGQQYFDLIKSAKAALNWSKRNDVELYSSDRIAQLFGSGICVCLPRSSGFGRYLGDDAAIYFDDADDLSTKVERAVRDGSWAEYGRLGRDQYRRLFNERRVAKYVLDFALGGDLSTFEWGGL